MNGAILSGLLRIPPDKRAAAGGGRPRPPSLVLVALLLLLSAWCGEGFYYDPPEPVNPSQKLSTATSGSTALPPTGTSASGSTQCYTIPQLESQLNCSDGGQDCTVVFVSISRQTGLPQYKFACENKAINFLDTLPRAEYITRIDLSNSPSVNITKTSFSRLKLLISLQLINSHVVGFHRDALLYLDQLSLLYIQRTPLPKGRLPRLDNQTYLQDMRVTEAGINVTGPADFAQLPSLIKLDLSHNSITRIGERTFTGACALQTLNLQYNRIAYLDRFAFTGLNNLQLLDLSHNPISRLDGALIGFDSLTTLKLVGTVSLKSLPPKLYSLKRLKVAQLEYAPHCCRFNKPKNISITDGIQRNVTPHNAYTNYNCSLLFGSDVPTTELPPVTEALNPICQFFPTNINCPRGRRRREAKARRKRSTAGKPTCSTKTSIADLSIVEDPEYLCRILDSAMKNLGEITAKVTWEEVILALNISSPPSNETKEPVECTPVPDAAFTPCDDLMTWVWLRVLVWMVFLFGLTVNLFVLLVVAFSTRRWDSYRELTLTLIAGDLSIAVFLGMLAGADIHTMGDYAGQALGWQKGAACQSAGFLSLLGSQLIMSTLLVITLERFRRITSHRVVKIRYIRIALACCWIYSIVVATLPLLGFSDYSTVATCMPFEADKLQSEVFLATVLCLDFVMAMIMVALYMKVTASTYMNSQKIFADTGNVMFQKQQFRVLKRSAPLIICNLLCVLPIAIIGLLSIFLQTAQIDNRVSKIVLVIIYPINCLANPILYGFGRRSVFRDHMYDFLYRRLGMYEKKFLRRRSKVFSSPTSSRRGSIDSTVSGLSTLRRGLSMPAAIISTNVPSFRRTSSDPGSPIGTPRRAGDNDSAYSSNSSHSRHFPCLFCPCGSPKRPRRHGPRRSSLPEDAILDDLRQRFAHSQSSTVRASADSQSSTITSKSALAYSSPSGMFSSGGLSPVNEADGCIIDPAVQMYESSL